MDEQAKKTALRMLTYGMYAVTAKDGDEFGAMTVNFVTQSSFDPPMIAVAMEMDSRTRRIVETCGHFALCVFRDDQRELAGQLGRRYVKTPGKFDNVSWKPSTVTGDPILEESLSWVECQVRDKVLSGDHTLYLAEVVGAGVHGETDPLTMSGAGFRHAG
jgi:flavin reductase (DIM6/NTAB) family NADH-FMN oxidoreductase RutF